MKKIDRINRDEKAEIEREFGPEYIAVLPESGIKCKNCGKWILLRTVGDFCECSKDFHTVGPTARL